MKGMHVEWEFEHDHGQRIVHTHWEYDDPNDPRKLAAEQQVEVVAEDTKAVA